MCSTAIMLCNNSYLDEIVTLANYAPTVDEWKKWLAKPQWTAAEAAALSLNISPELTKITRHENSSDWAIAMVAEGATYSLADREMASWMGPMTRATPTFHLILTEKGRVAGISLENQLYSRGIDLAAKALVSIDANLKKPSQWDFSVKKAPSDWIIQMQYWEWKLADGVLGIESTPDATPSKNTKSKEWYVGKWPDDVIYKNRVQVQRYLGIGRSSFYSKQRSDDLPKAENNGFYTKKSIDEAIAVTKARELANKEAEKAAKG